jgi:hypothetical protein
MGKTKNAIVQVIMPIASLAPARPFFLEQVLSMRLPSA